MTQQRQNAQKAGKYSRIGLVLKIMMEAVMVTAVLLDRINGVMYSANSVIQGVAVDMDNAPGQRL